jgi:hypothetical protein
MGRLFESFGMFLLKNVEFITDCDGSFFTQSSAGPFDTYDI